jgi:hypothetical protein
MEKISLAGQGQRAATYVVVGRGATRVEHGDAMRCDAMRAGLAGGEGRGRDEVDDGLAEYLSVGSSAKHV